jgi:hypothetical protein
MDECRVEGRVTKCLTNDSTDCNSNSFMFDDWCRQGCEMIV